jgi:hypothetical protein
MPAFSSPSYSVTGTERKGFYGPRSWTVLWATCTRQVKKEEEARGRGFIVHVASSVVLMCGSCVRVVCHRGGVIIVHVRGVCGSCGGARRGSKKREREPTFVLRLAVCCVVGCSTRAARGAH